MLRRKNLKYHDITITIIIILICFHCQVLDLGGNNLQILPREVFSRHGLLNLQKLKVGKIEFLIFSLFWIGFFHFIWAAFCQKAAESSFR